MKTAIVALAVGFMAILGTLAHMWQSFKRWQWYATCLENVILEDRLRMAGGLSNLMKEIEQEPVPPVFENFLETLE